MFVEIERLTEQNHWLFQQKDYGLRQLKIVEDKNLSRIDEIIDLKAKVDDIQAVGLERATEATTATNNLNTIKTENLTLQRNLSSAEDTLRMAQESRGYLREENDTLKQRIDQLERQPRQQSVHFDDRLRATQPQPTHILSLDPHDHRVRQSTDELSCMYDEREPPEVPNFNRPSSGGWPQRGRGGGGDGLGGPPGGGPPGGGPPGGGYPYNNSFNGSRRNNIGSGNGFPGGGGPPDNGPPGPPGSGPPGPPGDGPTYPGSNYTSGGTPRRSTRDSHKKFAGGDDPGVKKAFKAWLFEINHILEADAAYFSQTPFMAVNWVGTRTEGEAFSYIEDFLPASGNNVNPFKTAHAVVQYLKNIYGEFDDEAKVIEDYRKLTMKAGEDFDSFLAKFNSKACRLDHSDKQMQYDLHHKLNDKYRRRVGNMLLNSYNDLVIACRKLKNTFSIEEEHDKNHTDRPMKAQTGGGSSRYKPYRSKYTSSKTKNNGISLSTMPEKYRRLPKLTSSMRSQFSRDNKCWNCHEPSHRANQDVCPLYEYADLLKAQRLKDKATHLRMATLDDSDYDDQLSESELPSKPESSSEGEDLIDLNEDQSKD